MFEKVVLAFSILSIAYGSIALDRGFIPLNKEWPELVNKPIKEVKQALSEEYPDIEFKVFSSKDYMSYPEEFFYDRIRLVVDEADVIIVPPYLFGSQPDFSFAEKCVKKPWSEALVIVKENLPDTMIVVKQDGKVIDSINEGKRNYVLLEVDERGIVNQPPKYVRGKQN